MKSLVDRIFNYRINERTGCWEFCGTLDKGGYGVLTINHRAEIVHRLVWQYEKGEIPPNIFVCHTCDNPKCINTDHLFLGTLQDNHADMCQKDRHPKGIRHGMASITEDVARQIKDAIIEGERVCMIAKRFNVKRNIVDHIKGGRAWTHV